MKDKTVDQDEKFFVTGLETYLDAKSAVTMFENEVQKRVKDVVKKHEPALKKLFGEEHWALRGYLEPKSGMPDYRYLGQQVVFKGAGILYFYLCFGSDKENYPNPIACVMFWRERVTDLAQLWTSVKEISPEPDVCNSRFNSERIAPANDWASCEKALNAVIRDWTKLWQKLGGLPKYLPKAR